MTVTGTFVDATTGKPIPGVTVDFYPDGNKSSDPYATVTSDANGNFSYTSSLIDTEPNAIFDAYQTGYNEQIGQPAAFNGNVKLSEVTDATIGTGMLPLLIIGVLIFVIWYFKLYKHLNY